MKSKVSLIRCSDYDPALVFEKCKKAVDLIGGMVRFIKPGSSVLVNPNLLMAIEPEAGVDTHPTVVQAVVKMLKDIDCKVYLGDGPSVWGNEAQNIEEVYKKSGMERIAQEEQVELVRFDKRRWRGKFPLTVWLDTCDYLVSIPKFKTHNLTTLTAAIKNLYGLVPGTYKTELHKKYYEADEFSKVLVDIYEQAKPALTLVDAIVAMEGDGPGSSGKLRKCGLLLAGRDCVSIDSLLSLIMGLRPEDIITTKEAAQRGLGVSDIGAIEIIGEKLENVIQGSFKLPTASIKSKIPRPIVELAKNMLRFYPKVIHRNCVLCGACVAVCPQKIISIKNKRIRINYSKCISCFCCQETCPHSAIKVKKSILAKALRM